jgi:hypothetical protein
MPAAFDACVRDGGKVITKKLTPKTYMHICYPKGGGKPIAGEEKTYKKLLKK